MIRVMKNPSGMSGLVTLFLCVLLTSPHPASAGTGSLNRIEIYIYGPGIAQVMDVYGRRAGRDLVTGVTLREIPRSKVEMEGTRDRIPGWTVHIADPPQGAYRIKLVATGPGAFAIDVDTVDSAGNLSNHHLFRRVKNGDIIELLLNYSSDPDIRSVLREE